jgi:predicted nucleic acid-binding protein
VILLDTNVISELVKPLPDRAVVEFLRRKAAETLFTAAVCEAEIHYGLARMPAGRRRDELADRIAGFRMAAFPGRILPFDCACVAHYGEIRAAREATGKPIAVEDAMIAATARAYGAVVATHNVTDFVDCGIQAIDPWVSG